MLPTRPSVVTLLLLVCLGHVLLISVQVQSKEGLPVLQAAAFAVFARVQGSTAAVADAGQSFWSRYVALSDAARENEALRREVLSLQGRLQLSEAAAARARALEDLLALRTALPIPTVAARVIAGSPMPEALTITIDRGHEDGVETDFPVIDTAGVVGRVVGRPAARAARVQLLISGNAAAGARIERTGAGGIVAGSAGTTPLRMEFVSSLEDVQPEDRVVTSGQDGIYPPGLFIGTVEQVSRGLGPYHEITVRPAVRFSNLELVLVLLARPDGAGAGGR